MDDSTSIPSTLPKPQPMLLSSAPTYIRCDPESSEHYLGALGNPLPQGVNTIKYPQVLTFSHYVVNW